MKFLKLLLVMAMLAISFNASAALYSYVAPHGSGIEISNISIRAPENFTGRLYELYGAYELFGTTPPEGVAVGDVAHASNWENFKYINPASNISIQISYNNVVLWGADNYWDFVGGEIVNWSVYAWDYKTSYGVKFDSSIGGSWVIAQVPEPSSYAMLGLGLGLMGLRLSRNSSTRD
ncbi:PEP-CTERM sorting domain-containing protein [Methylobacillus gramineus]|uniref:PEP-CTERM sorting domain-containing protein n=1 Tax=Methylobacillus gramineus TaxID=755169 RepID=UPI001CFF97E2|nr:PEP-CTERM sorting domain-containing protein [Methylobacillus gramineus]MCB5184460.1 PEP-CTERM sorting domain-containing protein [Methylobacillus gramineus]